MVAVLELAAANPPLAPVETGPIQSGDMASPKVDFSVLSPRQVAAALNVLYGVDFDGLSPEQIRITIGVMFEERCTCGLQLAKCMLAGDHSHYSRSLATQFITELKRGTPVKPAGDVIFSVARMCAVSAEPASPIPIFDSERVNIRTAGAPVQGPADAKITIIEFSDFQCPGCAQASGWVELLMKAYPKDVRIVFKQFPLDIHEHSREAAEAALAANEQGKFWAMHARLFANGESLNPETIRRMAVETGLDMKMFDQALTAGRYREKVDEDIADGFEAGVNGTPLFFINGRRYNGLRTMEAIAPIIESEIKR